MNSAEERLREHIRQTLTEANLHPSQAAMRKVEDEVLALLQEYGQTPKPKRDEVYARGEEKILRALRESEATQMFSSEGCG